MLETVLITGANGVLAKALAEKLKEKYQIKFLTRKVKNKNEFLWDIRRHYIEPEALKSVQHVIHLTGASIAEKYWTPKRKKEILSGRVESANLIAKELKRKNIKLKTFLSVSAIGFYGNTTQEKIFKEEDKPTDDFLSTVCQEWESAALQFKEKNLAERVAIVRMGIILDSRSGMLQRILKPMQYHLAVILGSGKQYLPWIHLEDATSVFLFLLKNKILEGIYNSVAPEHINYKQFAVAVTEQFDKKNIFFPVPSFILKLFLGKMSTMLLNGSRVSSEKLRNSGFHFKYSCLEKALKNLLDP